MKKTTRILTVVCLLLCALMLVCIAAACDDNGDSALTYSVTVKLEDNTPVKDVSVKWGSFGPKTTDAEGKASIQLEKGTYAITLSNIDGYSYDAVSADENNLSVNIVLKPTGSEVTYSVTVLYPDGTPVEGVGATWCLTGEGGACFAADGATDAQGKLTIDLDPDEYHVQLLATTLPVGFSYAKDANGYYTGANATAAAKDITITLTGGDTVSVNAPGTYMVAFADGQASVTFEFTPATESKYAISSIGSKYDPKIVFVPSQYADAAWENAEDWAKNDNKDDSDKNFYYEIDALNTVDTLSFKIYLNDKQQDGSNNTYPAVIAIKVERLQGLPNSGDVTIVEIGALAQCADVEGDLSLVPVKESDAANIQKGKDGKYYLGDSVVYVQIATPLDDWLGNTLGALGVEDPEAPNPYEWGGKDFRIAIRGIDSNEATPADANCYYNKVNSDGAYYLDDVLKEFLELYAPNNMLHWTFACAVYGEGSSENPGGGDEPAKGDLSMDQWTEVTLPAEGYVSVSFTPAESGDYYLVVAEDMDMYNACPLSEVILNDVEFGETIYEAYTIESDDDGNYNIAFFGDKGVEIVFYLAAADYSPEKASVKVALNDAITPGVGKFFYDLTSAEGVIDCSNNNYYDILVTGLRGAPVSGVTLSIWGEDIALTDKDGVLVAEHVFIFGDSTITIESESKQNVMLLLTAALCEGISSYTDLEEVTTYFGAEEDGYYDIIVYGDWMSGLQTEITIEIDGTEYKFDMENSSAKKVLIPAFAEVVIRSSGVESEVNVAVEKWVEEVELELDKKLSYTFETDGYTSFRFVGDTEEESSYVLKIAALDDVFKSCPVLNVYLGKPNDEDEPLFNKYADNSEAEDGYYYVYFSASDYGVSLYICAEDYTVPITVDMTVEVDDKLHLDMPKNVALTATALNIPVDASIDGYYTVTLGGSYWQDVTVTLKVNGVDQTLVADAYGQNLIAKKVHIPADAIISLSSSNEDGENVQITLSESLVVGVNEMEFLSEEMPREEYLCAAENGVYNIYVSGGRFSFLSGTVTLTIGETKLEFDAENGVAENVEIDALADIVISCDGFEFYVLIVIEEVVPAE